MCGGQFTYADEKNKTYYKSVFIAWPHHSECYSSFSLYEY